MTSPSPASLTMEMAMNRATVFLAASVGLSSATYVTAVIGAYGIVLWLITNIALWRLWRIQWDTTWQAGHTAAQTQQVIEIRRAIALVDRRAQQRALAVAPVPQPSIDPIRLWATHTRIEAKRLRSYRHTAAA